MQIWQQGNHRPDVPQWKRDQTIILQNGSSRVISRIRRLNAESATVTLTDPAGYYSDVELWDSQLAALVQ